MNIEQVLAEVDPNVLVAAATVVLATIFYGKCIFGLGKSGSRNTIAWRKFWGSEFSAVLLILVNHISNSSSPLLCAFFLRSLLILSCMTQLFLDLVPLRHPRRRRPTL